MRFVILAVIATACGGRTPAVAGREGPPPFAAARWVPAQPSYVLASPHLDDAQRAARDAIDLVSAVTGYELADAMRMSAGLFGVDVLHADPLAEIGVDVRGGWAVFGDPSPTLVVHLAAPPQMQAFLDRQRDRGLVTRSVVVDRTDVVSAALPIGLTVSWAIDGDWMWVHVAAPGTSDDAERWFTASHAAHAPGWTGNWAWAQRAAGAAATLVGVLDLHALHGAIATAIGRLPDAVACARLVEPIGRVALAFEGDERHVSARLALDVGSTERLRAMLLPPPGGWAAATAGAALAAQWNLDLAAARPYLAPCAAVVGASLAEIDASGVRAGRAALLGFDPDALSGTGAIALDLTGPAYFEHQLDRVPLRRTLESSERFGPYRGHSLSIPFSVTVDYVLERHLAIAAIGDGLLARLVAPAEHREPVPPIAAIDVAPPALSAHAWQTLIDSIAERRLDTAPGGFVRVLVEHLRAWRDGHLAVTAEGSEIVVTASGHRR